MILNVFIDLWNLIVKGYAKYSEFIHSIFVNEAGDLIEYAIDILLTFFIIRAAYKRAFHTDE